MEGKTTTDEKYFSTLKYFRNSVIESERRQIDEESYFKTADEITFRNILTGIINPELSVEYINKYAEQLNEESNRVNPKHSNEGSKEDEIFACPVLICPIKLQKIKKGSYKTITPLWLPAVLNKAGKLSMPDEDTPWIDRKHLLIESTNNSSNNQLILGSIEQEEYYLTKNPIEEVKNDWQSYIQWSINYLKHFETDNHFKLEIADKEIEKVHIANKNYLADDHSYILLDPNPVTGVTEGIYKLYNHLLQERIHTPTLREFCNFSPKKRRKIKSDSEVNYSVSLHTGQMNEDKSLAESQRQALHHYLSVEEGEILAVNGPPGTGKTTLLQSVIANLVVDKALKDEDPPIIIASSANNQAITNIIRSFENDQAESSLLSQRWLPSPISSYALYCMSDNEDNIETVNKEGFLYTTLKGKGLPNEIETTNFVQKAETKGRGFL